MVGVKDNGSPDIGLGTLLHLGVMLMLMLVLVLMLILMLVMMLMLMLMRFGPTIVSPCGRGSEDGDDNDSCQVC